MAKILIVEDVVSIRFLIKASLENKGHSLWEAGNGLAAYEIIKRENPDLVILDVMMPGMNGYELCQLIKKNPVYSGTLVLMLTAKDQKEDREIIEKIGADFYLPKPFQPEILAKTVESLLQK